MRSLATVFALLVGVGLLAAPASGVLIKQLEPDVSLAEAVTAVSVASDHIEVDLTAQFKDPTMMGSPLVLEFTLEAADAGKDIWLTHNGGLGDVGQEVSNFTGEDWVDFHFVLVNVPGDFPPPLPPSAAASFTDLAAVTSDMFGDPVATGPEHVDFAGGPVGHTGVVHFSNIRIAHNGVEGGVFYLKQIPTPEPAALCLLVVGAAAFLRRRR